MTRKVSVLTISVLIVGGILFYLAGSGNLFGPSDKTQVGATAEKMFAAILQGDEAVLQAVLHKDFVFDAMDMLVGRREFISNIVSGDLWAKVADERELEMTGTSAAMITPFEANAVIYDEFFQFSGTMRVDFVKEEAGWLVRTIRVMPVL